MSAIVIPFPGVPAHLIRPAATCMEDLPRGVRALVASKDPAGGFAVVPRPPAASDARHRRTFTTADHALQFARRMCASHPRWYGLVIDESGQRRGTLDEIMGPGPDPMGLWEVRR